MTSRRRKNPGWPKPSNVRGNMAKTNRWMQKVSSGIKKRGTEGVFSARAHRQGHSTHEQAELDKHKSGKIGKRARLALAFASAKH